MGAVTFSLDSRLVAALNQALPTDAFVETGTFHGDTLENVRGYFRDLYSIEKSGEYFEGARRRFAGDVNIHLIHGDSRSALSCIVKQLQGRPTVYFLDAHWCSAEYTAGAQSQCPLLEELSAIGSLGPDSVVIIDDARLFLCTPPSPHDVVQWPEYNDVLNVLNPLSDDHQLMVVNDCILFFPTRIRDAVKTYARRFGVDWLSVLDGTRQKEEECEALRQVCNEKDRTIETLQDELARKNYALLTKNEEISRLRNLSDPSVNRAILFLRGMGARFVHRLAYPKLGKLVHHPPISLHPPAPYTCRCSPEQLPTISVVTPSWRQVRFIRRTIESVLNQGYPKLEYFVQDGGSTDGTVEILEGYADRLDGFASQLDKGQAHAINQAFARTNGQIMGWLNSDDMYLPGALAYVGDYFARHPDIDIVYGNRVLVDEQDKEVGRWVLPPHDDRVLSWADFIPQETLFWRRSVWDEVGGFVDESFRFALDWDLLLRFRNVGARMVRLPRFLGAFRIHEAQKTSTIIGDQGWEEMDKLRRQWTGSENVCHRQIRRGVAPYLARHVVHDVVWRWRERLGSMGVRKGG